jgi:hypothetical protein
MWRVWGIMGVVRNWVTVCGGWPPPVPEGRAAGDYGETEAGMVKGAKIEFQRFEKIAEEAFLG